MDEGVAGSTREESADFEGDVDVSVGTDEDDSSDNFGEANLGGCIGGWCWWQCERGDC